MRAIFFANSPGELYAWVRPTLKELRRMAPDVEAVIINPPCQWRSGSEGRVAFSLDGVNRVVEPLQYLKYLAWPGFLPWLKPAPETAIVQMGGESIYPLLLQRRLRAPLLAYEHFGSYRLDRFSLFMVSGTEAASRLFERGVEPGRVEVVGDLMPDSVEFELDDARAHWQIDAGEKVVSLFPGSRPFEMKSFAPFLLRVAEIMSRQTQGLRFFMSLSPFADLSRLECLLSSAGDDYMEGALARLCRRGPLPALHTEGGTVVQIVRGRQHDLMRASDLMLTIPGTKTMEAAFIGTPMVVIAPLNRAEDITVPGPAGLIVHLPLIGRMLKRALVKRLAGPRYPFVALPNIRCGSFLVPEVRGLIFALQTAEVALERLDDENWLRQVSVELRRVAGPAGAARRVAGLLVSRATGSAMQPGSRGRGLPDA